MPLGLYISVPFCRTKCSFCNFASDVFSKSAYENYVARLIEDLGSSHLLAAQLRCAIDESADTIYLGGGTPSILDGAQLLRIFAAVREQFAITRDAEITVECAPGTLTPALIATLLQCGVNRVSLGVQSFVDQEAQSVGRLHKRSTVLEEIARLREAGLANISIDLIAGLPHQTPESWAFSVSETIATGVPHASVYMLEVDDDSRLGRELIAGGARYHAHFVPDDDVTADFYQQACEMLEPAGIKQYEISNFARDTSQSRHNLKYWTRQPYIGFGVDAHSMLELPVWGRAPSHVRGGTAALGCPAERSSAATGTHRNSELATAVDNVDIGRRQGVRFATPDSLDAYMNREPHTVTLITANAAIEEKFFLGLRLNRGIDLERTHAASAKTRDPYHGMSLNIPRVAEHECGFGRGGSALRQDTVPAWESAIDQCLQDGLLEQQGTVVRLTARGRLLSNEVFARFLTEEAEETKVGTGNVNPR
jgi:oxygen-independent coproporphyrinogen-3 oxidase